MWSVDVVCVDTIVVNLRNGGGIFYEGIDAHLGKCCNFLPIILF